jgi:hypothetical protein
MYFPLVRILGVAALLALGSGPPCEAAAPQKLEQITPAAPDIPPILNANWDLIDKTFPTWVSLEAAFTSSGELVETAFNSLSLRYIRGLLSTPVDPAKGCAVYGEVYESWVNPPERHTLQLAVSNSKHIVLGKVLASEIGFDRGTAGTLFLMQPSRIEKGGQLPSKIFFFVPIARFRIAEKDYCKEDSRYPAPPRIGDEVLLLLPGPVGASDEFVDLRFETSLIVLPHNGSPRVPTVFRTSETDSLLPAPDRSEIFAAIAATKEPGDD